MSIAANSTLDEDIVSETGTKKYVLVTTIPVVLALFVVIILAFVIRSCWRKRQGSKEYRRVPTKDTPDNDQSERVKKRVQIILPDPPPPKMSITLATDLTKSNSKLPRYLPHKPSATVDSHGGDEPTAGRMGVAAPQTFVCLKLCINHNRLMAEVQNAVGLPCRADGTAPVPLVKLNVASREKKHNRKLSRTQPVSIDSELTRTIDCGLVVSEELEHSILHIEVCCAA